MTTKIMPYDERDGETGQFAPAVPDEEYLDAVRSVEHPTTGNIADEVGAKHRSAYDRLEKLEEKGRVEREKVNARVMFWRPVKEDTDDE